MRSPTRGLWPVVAGIGVVLICGCGQRARQTPASGSRSVKYLVDELFRPDPGGQVTAAQELANKPAEELKPFVDQLKKAMKQAPSRNIKAAIKKVLDKAGGKAGQP